MGGYGRIALELVGENGRHLIDQQNAGLFHLFRLASAFDWRRRSNIEMQRKNYFRSDAEIIVAGRKYSLSLAEQNALMSGSNYWHGEGNPSTWLAVSTLLAVRSKYPKVPDETVLALAALALGVSRDALVDLIRWHENYMRWHDGDETYQVLASTPDASADTKE